MSIRRMLAVAFVVLMLVTGAVVTATAQPGPSSDVKTAQYGGTTPPAAVGQAVRAAPPRLLGALALLGAASAAWTVGDGADALRWAAVLLALAAIVVAAAALDGPQRAAGIVLVVATFAAAIGVVGAIAHLGRIGEDICGAWRPAGPVRESPAAAPAGGPAPPGAGGGGGAG